MYSIVILVILLNALSFFIYHSSVNIAGPLYFRDIKVKDDFFNS